jgi:hypothetical protein
VAVETILVRHPLRVENLPDFVRLVAIHTRGKDVSLLLPEFSPDNLAMNDFNLRMTFRARFGYVAPCNRRRRIRVRKN